MTRLTEAQLAADAERTLRQREAAGLPRQIEDGPTLDRLAALVVAGRKNKTNAAGVGAAASERGSADIGAKNGQPTP